MPPTIHDHREGKHLSQFAAAFIFVLLINPASVTAEEKEGNRLRTFASSELIQSPDFLFGQPSHSLGIRFQWVRPQAESGRRNHSHSSRRHTHHFEFIRQSGVCNHASGPGNWTVLLDYIPSDPIRWYWWRFDVVSICSRGRLRRQSRQFPTNFHGPTVVRWLDFKLSIICRYWCKCCKKIAINGRNSLPLGKRSSE